MGILFVSDFQSRDGSSGRECRRCCYSSHLVCRCT